MPLTIIGDGQEKEAEPLLICFCLDCPVGETLNLGIAAPAVDQKFVPKEVHELVSPAVEVELS